MPLHAPAVSHGGKVDSRAETPLPPERESPFVALWRPLLRLLALILVVAILAFFLSRLAGAEPPAPLPGLTCVPADDSTEESDRPIPTCCSRARIFAAPRTSHEI